MRCSLFFSAWVFMFSVGSAHGEIVLLHYGATDPELEGWQSDPGIPSVTPVGPIPEDMGYPAWYVADVVSGVSGSSDGYWGILTAEEKTIADLHGWRLRAKLRAANTPDAGAGSVVIYYFDGTKQWLLDFESNSLGEQIVTAVNSSDLNGIDFNTGSMGYHLYEIVYDPTSDTAGVLVDGVERIAGWSGIPSSINPGWFKFGSASSPDTGQGNYNMVDFALNPSQDTDSDSDGIPDNVDNCTLVPNGPLIPDAGGNSQRDTDNDGFGNMCDGDLNNDCIVNAADLAYVKEHFFDIDQDADLNGNGFVNAADLAIIKQMFFGSPGPSGLASCQHLVFGLKSCGSNSPGFCSSGIVVGSLPPTYLYSFQSNGSEFLDLGAVTVEGNDIDADGLAYSPSHGLLAFELEKSGNTTIGSHLISVNPTTAEATRIGTMLVGRDIRGAVFDKTNSLWALDATSNEVMQIDPNSATIVGTPIGLTLNDSLFNLSNSVDIAVDSNGSFYIVDRNDLYLLDLPSGALNTLHVDTTTQLAGAAIVKNGQQNVLIAYDVADFEDIYSYDLDAGFNRTNIFINIIPTFNAGRGDLAAISDGDNDGIADSVDNSTLIYSPAQRDSNGGGYADFCNLDINNGAIVNATRLADMKANIIGTGQDADFDGNGKRR